MVEKNRDIVLDVAKALAIIGVVFNHVFEACVSADPSLSQAVYFPALHAFKAGVGHFIMAVFMFASGYLSFGKSDFRFVMKRFLHFVPVFIVWTIVYYYTFPIIHFPPLAGNLFQHLWYYTWTLALSGGWFLLCLFFLYLLMYIIKGNIWGILGIILVTYTVSQVSWPLSLKFLAETNWFSLTSWFMFFFAGGYLISKHREKLCRFGYVKWICLAAFPVIGLLGKDLENVSGHHWPDYYVFMNLDFTSASYNVVMAVLGIGLTLAIADLLVRLKVTRVVFVYLGGITLGIYLAHGFFRFLPIGSGVFRLVAVTIVSLGLSSAITWVLQKFKVTDYVFLGGVRKLILPEKQNVASSNLVTRSIKPGAFLETALDQQLSTITPAIPDNSYYAGNCQQRCDDDNVNPRV